MANQPADRTSGPATAPPSTVRNAALLMWGLIGLMAARTLLTIVFLDDLVDSYQESLTGGDQLPRGVVEQGAPAYVPIAVGSLLILGGLLALCAVFVQRGARWARFVAMMFASLSALGGLLTLIQPTTALFTVLGLLNAVVGLAIIVLLFSGRSNVFFARRPVRR